MKNNEFVQGSEGKGYIMIFEIVANHLARSSMIKSLKLSNKEYDVTFFYEGDYEKDRNEGRCDFRNVSMSCKTKGDNIPLMLMSGKIFLDISEGFFLDLENLDRYRAQLNVAGEAATELQRLLAEYFDVEQNA